MLCGRREDIAGYLDVEEIKPRMKKRPKIRIMPRHRLDDPRKGTEQHLTNGPWLRRSLEWMCGVVLNISFPSFLPRFHPRENSMSGGVEVSNSVVDTWGRDNSR